MLLAARLRAQGSSIVPHLARLGRKPDCAAGTSAAIKCCEMLRFAPHLALACLQRCLLESMLRAPEPSSRPALDQKPQQITASPTRISLRHNVKYPGGHRSASWSPSFRRICQQGRAACFTEDQIRVVLQPLKRKMQELGKRSVSTVSVH